MSACGRAQFADGEIPSDRGRCRSRWAYPGRGRSTGCRLDLLRAPTTARGSSTSRQTERIGSGWATTRSATRAQKPCAGTMSRGPLRFRFPRAARKVGRAERPEDRSAEECEHRRGQRQGRDQCHCQRQRDRRAGVLDLGKRREIEHAQADDHGAGTGDQRGTDLRDRFVAAHPDATCDGAAPRNSARSRTGSNRFRRRRARRSTKTCVMLMTVNPRPGNERQQGDQAQRDE